MFDLNKYKTKILNFAKFLRKIWNIQQKHLPLQKKNEHSGVSNARKIVTR